MKKIILIILLLAFEFSLYAMDNPRIAVLPFDPVGVSDSEAQTVTVLFETGLVNTGLFNVIEQNKLKEILEAQTFSLSACTDDACAVEVGELLSAEQIVLGSFSKVAEEYIINAKIIDVSKGTHIKADKVAFSKIAELTDSVDLLSYIMAGLTYTKGEETFIADEFGDILISTDPSEAEIYINGILKGSSPDLFSKVPRGTVRIEAKKDNLYATEEVDISTGLKEIHLKLSILNGNLYIKSGQRKIDVYMDETLIGPLDNGLFRDIPAGEHTFKLLNDEYFWEDKLFIEPHISTRIEVYPRAYGYIEYSIPEGAVATVTSNSISVNFRGVGRTPVWADKYSVKYEGSDYIGSVQEISVPKGDIFILEPKLEFTELHKEELKVEAHDRFLLKIEDLEHKYHTIKHENVGQLITDISRMREKLTESIYSFPILEYQCKNLYDRAIDKQTGFSSRAEITQLQNRRDDLQLQLETLEKEQRKFRRRKGFWGFLSLASFGTSGYLFYESNNLFDQYNDAEITQNAINLRHETIRYDIGKYTALPAGVLFWLISSAVPSNKENIRELEEQMTQLSIKIAALESEK